MSIQPIRRPPRQAIVFGDLRYGCAGIAAIFGRGSSLLGSLASKSVAVACAREEYRGMSHDAGAFDRVAREIGGPEVVDRLAALSASDFTSLMLDVTRRRAAAETPASVLRRYRSDRFTRPSGIPWQAERRAQDTLVRCLPDGTELVALAPLVPLGAHSAVAPVSQHKVMTTIRACEVAADPTNALALEAAVRRQDAARQEGTSGELVRLAAIQRVVRAQRFGPGMAAHFGLFAMVTAGRDEGSLRFETAALAEHLRFAVDGLRAAGAPDVVLALTPLSDPGERLAATVREEFAGTEVAVVAAPAEAGRQAYYRHLCFKVHAAADGVTTEIGDGGFTDWTARMTGNGKERLLISGYGTDRLATLAADRR